MITRLGVLQFVMLDNFILLMQWVALIAFHIVLIAQTLRVVWNVRLDMIYLLIRLVVFLSAIALLIGIQLLEVVLHV